MKQNQDKFILDATAGYRYMWFNKEHPNCIYLDQRPECEPDIVGDFRDLKQFPDQTFQLIIFDPPHIIDKRGRNATNMMRDFGSLMPDTWKVDIKQGAHELWRLLKPMGILLFKWNNQQIPSNQLIKLFPEPPLVYQISTNKEGKTRAGKRIKQIQTLWFCFMKIKDEEKKECEKPT